MTFNLFRVDIRNILSIATTVKGLRRIWEETGITNS
jgi:hypothetical protein